jgi:hypothetical protein
MRERLSGSMLVVAICGAAAVIRHHNPSTLCKCRMGSHSLSSGGYEAWQVVSISHDGPLLAAILANPVMIDAYSAGVPGNGKPFPDGAKLAKIHWNPKMMETFPTATVPGTQHDIDFMVKDSKRFADRGEWGWMGRLRV